jgi:NAD(P)-dependent dehydrogenase (short-subunit alcohol dehydrogenase family)
MTSTSASASHQPANLSGRTVLVTGGNGGIGLAMARALGQAGASVIIWGRQPDKTNEAVAQLQAEGITASGQLTDISDLDQLPARFAEAVELGNGRIDSVIANAGRSGSVTPFINLSLTEWRDVLSVNLDSTMVLFQEAARHMIPAGGGALVAVSSLTAIHGSPGNEAYGVSKTALLGLTRSLAVGLARHKIRVNALLPGWTRTELSSVVYDNEKFRNTKIDRTPVRRWADPSEMGPAAVFLADPTMTFHTGDEIVVDGGYTRF